MIGQPKAQDASQLDINLSDPSDQPKDTVSSIAWAPGGTSPTFATSDWDSQIRIYRVKLTPDILVQDAQYDAGSSCLSVEWHDNEAQLFAGCTDGTVKLFDIASGGKCREIRKHEGPVKSVHWISSIRTLVTVSFDKTIRLWDPRQDGKEVTKFELQDKPFCSDLLYPYLAVGLSDGKALVVDLAKPLPAFHYVNSPLGNQTQIMMIKLSREKEGRYGIGVSGNNGRSNVSKIDVQSDSTIRLESAITFKVPEKVRNNETTRYPVNCFGFHPHLGSRFIYTGEGDGRMFFWDCVTKGRIADFDFKGNAMTQAEIDPTGKYMAYSLGYDWARGIQGYMSQPSKVCVHVLEEKELEYRNEDSEIYPFTYP